MADPKHEINAAAIGVANTISEGGQKVVQAFEEILQQLSEGAKNAHTVPLITGKPSDPARDKALAKGLNSSLGQAYQHNSGLRYGQNNPGKPEPEDTPTPRLR